MSFSERHGYETSVEPIRYREDASENLREMIIEVAEKHGLTPHSIRSDLCGLLFIAPDHSNWSAYPNVERQNPVLLNRWLSLERSF